jgi:hypothetical protein
VHGYVIKRGSRTAPKFVIKFDVGLTADGKRVQRMKLLRGVRDIVDARHRSRLGRHVDRSLGVWAGQPERVE